MLRKVLHGADDDGLFRDVSLDDFFVFIDYANGYELLIRWFFVCCFGIWVFLVA